MEESVLFPSPNWFQPSGITVNTDGWIVYGGPNKSICVLEPILNSKSVIKNDTYHAHMIHRAHSEKIVSVDFSPEWPNKKLLLSGSADGGVKQWSLELVNNKYKFKSTHSHDIHHNNKEEVVGVGYSSEVYAVTVGNFGRIVKWNFSSNVVKSYSHFLKHFRPLCMSCSPHIVLQLAVGTKQGVVFVLDLNGKLLYKVRGQDDEIIGVSWCPQYEVLLKKYLKESTKRVSANERMNKIRLEAEHTEESINVSGISKNLPEDSFDESIVQEEDLFDMYKDHEIDSFGPKKFEPEEILVKVKDEIKVDDSYLNECMKLKEAILKRKNEPEPSMASLVEALQKTHVKNETKQIQNEEVGGRKNDECTEASQHIHKSLLATLGKHGGVRIWSKTGKLVASCCISSVVNKNQKIKQPSCTTLLWQKQDTLLIADGRSQLLSINPLKLDCKNKLEYRVAHTFHKRGLYAIISNAPRVQTTENTTKELANRWSVWTAGQDRNLIHYSLANKKMMSMFTTCGGFIYNIKPCPYDAGKLAISVGDGAVRIWEAETADDDDTKLLPVNILTYWQNVQGKVLTLAWHPTKENLLAFGTAESRVGLIDTNGKTERGARTFVPALSGGIYSLCWGEGDQLFASAGGKLVLYRTTKIEEAPESIKVSLEGQKWEISCVQRQGNLLSVGTLSGTVAIIEGVPPYTVLAVNYVYTKIIYNAEWHPQQTSESNEESAYKNLLAITALDRQNTITILEYSNKEDGTKQLQNWKTFSGHTNTVLQLVWNPHRDELLLSTSQDSTIRVWDIIQGTCVSIFGGHEQYPLCASWCARPQLYAHVFSGGADYTMRLWCIDDYPADAYKQNVSSVVNKKDKKKNKEKKEGMKAAEEKIEIEGQAHLAILEKVTTSKKFLLPIIHRQMINSSLRGARAMLNGIVENGKVDISFAIKADKEKYGDEYRELFMAKKASRIPSEEKLTKDGDSPNIEEGSLNGSQYLPEQKDSSIECKDATEEDKDETFGYREYGIDFLKLFGDTNDVNELLDMEMEQHLVTHNTEAWIMLSILRGHIDSMIQFANQRGLLCPYLLSIAPCVSFKYWKDATQLYLAQIDRLVAKGEEEKLYQFRYYGGTAIRKVGLQLSVHDAKGAVATLLEARLYKEAYVLCRTRHMDSIARDVLHQWTKDCYVTGSLPMVAICLLVLGELSEAATLVGKSNKPEYLSLAADLAKLAGHTTYADYIEEKKSHIKPKEEVVTEAEEMLNELPTRMELLLKDNNGDSLIKDNEGD